MAQAVRCHVAGLPGVHQNSRNRLGLPSDRPSRAYPRHSEQTAEPRRRPEFCGTNQKQVRLKGEAASHSTNKTGISDCAEQYDNLESSDACLHETSRIDQAWPVRLKTVTPSKFAKFNFR